MLRNVRGRARAILLALAMGSVAPRASAQSSSAVRDAMVPVAPGVSLHVREAGRGPCVLLLTGWTIPIDIWQPTIDRLAARHRVIAVEPRGQGRSSPSHEGLTPHGRARDLAVLHRRRSLAPCVVVGWSLGALDAIALAAHAPHAVRALVLLDQPVHADTSDAANRAVIRAAARLQTDFGGEIDRFVRGMFRQPVPEAVIDSIVRGVRRTTSSAAIAMMIGEVTTPLADVYQALSQPILLLTPTGSSSDTEFRWMTTAARSARRIEIDGSGHALMRDQPDRVADAIARFTAEHVLSTPP